LGRRSTSATSCGSGRDDGPKRLFDVLAAVGLGVLLSPLMLGLAILVRTTSKGPAIYWSKRIGKNNLVFKMPKFRTMRMGTPAVASHLLDDPGRWVTPVGRFLRKLSLDELPQLYSIVKGDMSFVGPRPALFNQDDLVALRTRKGVHRLVPGVTGWAQVNGRDELPIPIKVEYDEYYLQHQSLSLEVKILGLTIIRVARRSGVSH
jgi:O-antigen biosynthesis protein WbqP